MRYTEKIAKVLGGGILVFAFALVTLTALLTGYIKGFQVGVTETQKVYEQKVYNQAASSTTKPVATITPKPVIKPSTPKPAPASSLSGPTLWDAVNKRRVEFGVNPLKQRDELCTIASIRLNQLLDRGSLDGHEGFAKLPTDRPDLKWIFEKYNISEFLVSGATSASDAVALWENSLGHKKLLSGGEYSFGCIYAQNGFGVAIAAY
ncbi:MAG TPA: CAP domain-containing protein [Patescibacteria group bacterium]|nr:CAP domain-containing protein [Patescibacteria group bacterium]